MHIHYTKGPEVLADVSREESDAIIKLIDSGADNNLIQSECQCTLGVVEALRYMHSSGLRRCCWCGKFFDPKGHSRAISCSDVHYMPCVGCGVSMRVNESYAEYMKAGGRRCPACRGNQIGLTRRSKSPEERAKIVAKQQATMISKYGAAVPLQVPELKAKIHATVKERYGVDNVSQSAEIQNRIKENSQKRFGVDHYSNAPEIRQRMIDGMVAKYGVTAAQKCPEIQKKTKQTNLARYGVENVMQSEQSKQSFVRNHRAKYGVDWPRQRPDIVERARQTNFRKYNAPMYPISDEYMRTFISDPSMFDNYKAFIADPEAFILSHFRTKPSAAQVSELVGITDSAVYERLISAGKRDLALEFISSMEAALLDYLHSIDETINVVKHDRSVLEGKEIDLYLPDYHLGFECNPTCTHNSSFKDPWGGDPKHYKYHAQKSILAANKDVFLYHVFGYEWANNRSAVLSQIRNLLGKNTSKIYGRATDLCSLSYAECKQFLDANHRQGNAQSAVRLGLRSHLTNQLVSVMTFSKMRHGIGKKAGQSDTEWELVRFCNLQNTSVVGGASKLLSYFVAQYHPTKIVSFSDVAHTRGMLYERLGFQFISLSDPGYVWVDLKTDRYYNRVTCQKSNLTKLFEDVTEETIASSTENQIMMDHGYARVFDSGVIRWEKFV